LTKAQKYGIVTCCNNVLKRATSPLHPFTILERPFT